MRCSVTFLLMVLLMLPGCPPPPDQVDDGIGNSVDKTNGGAALLGTDACVACHTDVGAESASHLHFSGEARATGTLCPPVIPPAGNECESCHGPGGNHIGLDASGKVVVDRRAIFVDPVGVDSCSVCHGCDASDTIPAADGFISGMVSANELRVSGGHAGFSCMFCHDPHIGRAEDSGAIRNDCTVCHSEQNMALHDGKTFRGPDGQTEVLTCESCHMPYASVLAESGMRGDGRVGDRRTHVFRLSTEADGLTSFFSPDGGAVLLDSDGQAAVPVEFSCLRCHNTAVDGLFSLSAERAAEIAGQVHADFTPR